MSFENLIARIPAKIHARTKTFISKDVALFEPDEYIIQPKICIEDYHFIIFHSTPPRALIGDKEYQFKKGSLISLEPYTEIAVYPQKKYKLCQYVSIGVKKSFVEKVAFEAFGSNKIKFESLENTYSSQLLEAINNFKYELSNFGEKYPIMIKSISTQIAFLLLRDTLASSSERSNRIGDINGTDYVTKAIDYMNKYYSCNITISDICRAIFLSPGYFNRLFKNKIGMTPYKYLCVLRINKSKELLSESAFSIEEIARICGFANTGHLSTVFRKTQGLSPSEFKKKLQTNRNL